MESVAIYHPIFGTGGGEAVCMNVLEALQDQYNPVLYTLSDIDIESLNRYFNTEVSTSIPVVDGGASAKALRCSYDLLNDYSASGFGRLHASAFGRILQSELSNYELVFSTFGEFPFDTTSVQYIHYPMFNRQAIPEPVESKGILRQGYNELCDLISGYWRQPLNNKLLANSEWTADLAEKTHNVPTETLYPPVDTAGFDPIPWEQREDGFVAIGRIDPSKRIEDLIEIIEQVQERGHNLPLHIVGPRTHGEYYKKIQSRASANDNIFLTGKVSREELIEYVCSYKYGLHGMHYEHFGIVVAEFIAGGAVPFVHDSGGQREIVDNEDQLRYRSISDAVNKIDQVLSNPDEQVRLKGSLPDIERRFGKERFQHEIRQVVQETLLS